MSDMGLTHFATRAAALRFERAAKAGLVAEAKEQKFRLDHNLGCIVSHMESLLRYGVAKDAIAEALKGLRDAIVNADEACKKIIDDAGEHADDIDMTEFNALLEKVSA